MSSTLVALWTLIHSSLVKYRCSRRAEKGGFASLICLVKLERKIFFRTLLTESRTCPPLTLSLANVKGTNISDLSRPSLTCEPFTGAGRSVAVWDRNLVHLLRFPHPPLCLSLGQCSVPSCHFSTSRLWWSVGVASRAAAKEPQNVRTYLSFGETWFSGRWGKELGENQTDTSPFLFFVPGNAEVLFSCQSPQMASMYLLNNPSHLFMASREAAITMGTILKSFQFFGISLASLFLLSSHLPA